MNVGTERDEHAMGGIRKITRTKVFRLLDLGTGVGFFDVPDDGVRWVFWGCSLTQDDQPQLQRNNIALTISTLVEYTRFISSEG